MNSEQKTGSISDCFNSLCIALATIVLLLSAATGQNNNKKTNSAPPSPARTPAPPTRAPAPANTPPRQTHGAASNPLNSRPATPANRTVPPNRSMSPASINVPAKTPHTFVPPNPGTTHPPATRANVQPVNIPRATTPGKTVSLRSGGTANIRPNGKFRSIDRGGTHIQYGAHGGRTITSVQNGSRIVTTGTHQGYVQRTYTVRNGRTYVQRTYVANHVTYTAAYRSYYVGGTYYYGYAPAYYYHPAFYGWAYRPWPARVYWNWGWTPVAYPWYGYYGSYFAPYPSYPSAAFWLTDYVVASDLQAAYAARADDSADRNAASDQPAAQDNSGGSSSQHTVALSPEVKQAIAEEVRSQLAAEQDDSARGSSGGPQVTPGGEDVPPALDPARRTFIVFTSLDVTGNDQECALTPGDVVTRLTDTPDQDQKVTVSVATSKKADCVAGKQVLVSVQDLQEMHNHFRQQLDDGLKELVAKQGTAGMPSAPDIGTIAGEVPPPPPDATAAKSLQDQEAVADQTEKDVAREAAGGS